MITDNDIYTLVIGILRDALTARSVNAIVKQAYQPRQQGTPTQNTVFIHKKPNKRYGFLGRDDVLDLDNDVFTHTESQWIEADFQIGGLAIQNPADSSIMTASDLVNLIATIMQSDVTRSLLIAHDVGILRITNIYNLYFTDDKERFEQHPVFDFTLTYEQIDISEVPVLQSTELKIIEV